MSNGSRGWRAGRRAGVISAALLAMAMIGSGRAQARPPLAVADDPSGALSAIRSIDVRQLCICRAIRLDTIVRVARETKMFDVLKGKPRLRITAADLKRLRLAKHRVIGTSLPTILGGIKDTALMAVAMVPTKGDQRRYLIVVTPPNGVTAAFLVALGPHREKWRVLSLTAIYD